MTEAMENKRYRWTSAAAKRILKLAGDPRTVEEAVQVVATRLLQGVPCPPTDLEALKYGLSVNSFEAIPDLPISGELRKDGDGFKVVYSARLSPGRKRFTIAHELGHAIFETTGPNCPRYGNELERICDMLAAELLLPRKIFAAHIGSDIGPVRIYELARDFETSVMATALRCFHLFGISVFQVENANVAWGYGVVRQQRDMRPDMSGFQAAITQAMDGIPGEASVLLRGSAQVLRWVGTPGQRRALFVLQPRKRATGAGMCEVRRHSSISALDAGCR